MKILHLDSSPQAFATSVSRQLSSAAVARLHVKYPNSTVVYRDLATDAPAHLTSADLAGVSTPAEQWNDKTKAVMVINDAILNEFQNADVIVIGVPMYNFSTPSSLKSWIDRVARAGVTFKYTDKGVEGLVKDKSVIILSSRGGFYEGTAWGPGLDHQEKYLQDFFAFLGITDCTRIRAEGTSMGESVKTNSINGALAQIAIL
jgi:FMN-dependent NADH-azoreductase